MRTIASLISAFAAALLVELASPPTPVWACGGLFCSQQPVVQTRERIVFEVDGHRVRAWIQVQFSGSDPSFAWIIPVASVPEIEVATGQTMFDVLERETQPRFIAPASGGDAARASTSIGASGCEGYGAGGPKSAPSAPPSITAKIVPAPKVDVWSTVEAGPYDAVTLSAMSARDATIWLDFNGYRVLPGSTEILQRYLDEGLKLVAVRLHPGRSANTMTPIKLTYTDSRGCATIPIRLTAIATAPNLEILAWAFAPSRVAPQNYASIAIDETALTGAGDYMPALRSAVRAAGGHAFVTEYAQPTVKLDAAGSEELADLIAHHSWVTRVRTVMSASDMTKDPELQPDTGEVGRTPKGNEVYLGGKPVAAVGAGAMVALLGLGVHLCRRRR
jgi:hypothetical protein